MKPGGYQVQIKPLTSGEMLPAYVTLKASPYWHIVTVHADNYQYRFNPESRSTPIKLEIDRSQGFEGADDIELAPGALQS